MLLKRNSAVNARQIQAMYNYERVILNAYLEVSNQLSNIDNRENDLKSKQVAALDRSIEISNDLFKSARVDYLKSY
jgi:outer membrane protein TolC